MSEFLTNTAGGQLQSFSVNISEQQLSDQISFATVGDVNIMELVQGRYLDYDFSMRVEEISQNGILKTCQCCADIDELLYTQINYKIDESDRETVSEDNTVEQGTWYSAHVVDTDVGVRPIERIQLTAEEVAAISSSEVAACRASTHVRYISNALGIPAVQLYFDFISSMDVEQNNITYADLISTLFGWTSRVETLMINAFIQNGTLFIIQRGYEQNTIDITDTRHTLPNITRRLVRKTWGSEEDSVTTIQRKTQYLYVYDLNRRSSANFTQRDGDTSYQYTNELITVKDVRNDDGSRTTTQYEYDTHKGYRYLKLEIETTTDKDGETSVRKTVHTPLLNGQMETRIYVDDEYKGSSIGQGISISEPSEKTLRDEIQPIYAKPAETYDVEVTIPGNPLIDSSFPVYNRSLLVTLTDALRAMNRQTQETVTMDIFNFDHLINFNDKIIFDGNVYFLQSNSAVKNVADRIENRQSIQLVRWY